MPPVSEVIEQATRFASLGFDIFPLGRLSKLPLPRVSWLKLMTQDPTKIAGWLGSGDLNYGLHPGAGKVIIDVDTKNGKKGGESYLWLDSLHGWPETLEQTTPTGGKHLIYSTPIPVANSVDFVPGIDVRGWHGYVVGAGSTVPAGEYRVSKDVPIAPAPEWLLEMLRSKTISEPKAPTPVTEATPGAEDRCRRFLEALPVSTEGSRNADAYVAACGCRDRGADPGMTRDLMASVWKCEPPLPLDELEVVIIHAFSYARSAPGSHDPTKIFPVTPVDPPLVTPTPVDLDPVPLSPLARYNEMCCVCGGEVWVQAPDEQQALVWRPMSRAAFTLHFNNDLAIFDGGKREPIWKHWLGWEHRRTVDQVVFAPGLDLGTKSLNLWQGWTADPNGPVDAEGEWAAQAWFDHVVETLCWNDPALSHKVIGWCAQMVQAPEEKPLWALVITGAKGTGKNAFADRLGELFLNNYVVATHDRYLKSNFNSHIERALMFVLNEAKCTGDDAADASLKALVTDKYTTIERKGIDPYQRRVYARIILQGNDDWQVRASSDERRYCVLQTSMVALNRMGRQAYNKFFERMRKGFEPEHGGRNALLKRLLEYDISDVDFSHAPETPHLSAQKELSLSQTFSWWLEGLKSGKVLGGSFPLGWPDKPVAKGLLLKARNEYVYSMGGRIGVTMTKLTRDLKRCCPSLDSNQRTHGKDKEMAFKLPTLEKARNEWNEKMNMSVNWPQD